MIILRVIRVIITIISFRLSCLFLRQFNIYCIFTVHYNNNNNNNNKNNSNNNNNNNNKKQLYLNLLKKPIYKSSPISLS